MAHCNVSGKDCPDMENCVDCLEWLVSCDGCHFGGHTDGGWKGYLVGHGSVRTLCDDCYEIEGGEAKEDAQELIWGNATSESATQSHGEKG